MAKEIECKGCKYEFHFGGWCNIIDCVSQCEYNLSEDPIDMNVNDMELRYQMYKKREEEKRSEEALELLEDEGVKIRNFGKDSKVIDLLLQFTDDGDWMLATIDENGWMGNDLGSGSTLGELRDVLNTYKTKFMNAVKAVREKDKELIELAKPLRQIDSKINDLLNKVRDSDVFDDEKFFNELENIKKDFYDYVDKRGKE